MQALLFSGWWKMASSLSTAPFANKPPCMDAPVPSQQAPSHKLSSKQLAATLLTKQSVDAKDFTLFNPLWVNKQQHAQHAQQPMDVHDAHKRPT